MTLLGGAWLAVDRCARREGTLYAIDLARQFRKWAAERNSQFICGDVRFRFLSTEHVTHLEVDLSFYKGSLSEMWSFPWNMHKFASVRTLVATFSFSRSQYACFTKDYAPRVVPSLDHVVFRVNKCIDDDLSTWQCCIVDSTICAWKALQPALRRVTWQVPFESPFPCEGRRWSSLPRFHGNEDFERAMDDGLLDFSMERQPDPRSPGRAALEEFVNAPYRDIPLSRVLFGFLLEFGAVGATILVALLLRFFLSCQG